MAGFQAKDLRRVLCFNPNINSLKLNSMKKLMFSTLYVVRLTVDNLFGLNHSNIFSGPIGMLQTNP